MFLLGSGVVHAFNSRTQEAEAGNFGELLSSLAYTVATEQSRLHSETYLKTKPQDKGTK